MGGGSMKRIVTIFMLAIFLASAAPAFAAGTGSACNSCAQAAQEPKKTIFNSLSDFFSTFDRPFTRPGNKQGFWNATADWLRGIDKQ